MIFAVRVSLRLSDHGRTQLNNIVAILVSKKVSQKCQFTYKSGNFHAVLPDFLVFWIFYSNGVSETYNSDNAIEFSIKKYIYSQIFTRGTEKFPAPVPHPRVLRKKRFMLDEMT